MGQKYERVLNITEQQDIQRKSTKNLGEFLGTKFDFEVSPFRQIILYINYTNYENHT